MGMALLISCWFIIESIIIPHGFLKWFYLSFYIHPFFLVFCQLFLWLQLLIRWILFATFYPFRIVCFLALFVFRFFRNRIIKIFLSFNRVANDVQVVTEEAGKFSLVVQSCNRNEITGNSYIYSNISPTPCKLTLIEFQKNELVEEINFEEHVVLHGDENLEELNSCSDNDTGMDGYLASIICRSNSCSEDVGSVEELDSPSACSSYSPAENRDMTEFPPTALCVSITSVAAERQVAVRDEHQDQSDPFYKKYTERMRWFDLLNYDRTCGISSVLNKQFLGTPSSFDSNSEAMEMSTPHLSLSKQTKKRLLRSLESDFEIVYVAQSCLSWEALQYQYTKVKALAESSSQNGVFYGNIVGEFQKFQVLLERFLEDEMCEGKRIWNYVRGRFALKSLLQVPQISGFSEEENVDVKGEAIGVKEVLKAIERCEDAFVKFVRADNKKPAWWKLIKNSLLWTYPPLEDPRDLEILCSLNRNLQKKELWLKDLQGKQRCWLKKVLNPVEESQRKEILFTMIDMKLVSRVLQMYTISSSQLKWCQEKLDNIEFKEGKVFRVCSSTGPLFPLS